VIHNAQKIRVLLPIPPGSKPSGTDATRRRIFEAKVIGTQPEVDLALLKIEASNLPFLPIENPRPVQLGEVVFAIGSPEGFENSVTMGIVSAANRQVENAFPMTFIQTDTAINPGNSGGPLVNTHGALVGINTFIMSRSGGSEGLGFAIPGATAEFVYNSLRKYGRVRRIETGIHCQPITPELAAGMNLSRDWGVIVSDVDPNGSAKAAGVEPGDIIDSFDGHPIQNLAELVVAVANHPFDQTVRLKVVHGEQTYTLHVLANESTRATDQLGYLAMTNEGLLKRLGIVVVDIDDRIRKILPQMRSETGVVVGAQIQDVTSPETGLRAGDIIRSLNKTSVESVDGLKKLVGDLKSGDAVALQVEREGRLTFVSFEME
jgi:serine protease Do